MRLPKGKIRVLGTLALTLVFFAALALSVSGKTKKNESVALFKGEAKPLVIDDDDEKPSIPQSAPTPTANPNSPAQTAPKPSQPVESRPPKPTAPPPPPPIKPKKPSYPVERARDDLNDAQKALDKKKYDKARLLASEVFGKIRSGKFADSGERAEEYRTIMNSALEIARDAGEKLDVAAPSEDETLIFIF